MATAADRYGRAPWPTPEQMTAEQRAMYDAILASPRNRDEFVNEHGQLIGPFNARLLDPKVGTAIQAVGAALRFSSTLSDRERELVILTVAREELSEHEWRIHSAVALAAGVSEGELACLGARDCTWLEVPAERACVELAREILCTGDVSDETFDAALSRLDTGQIFDVVSLVGHYRDTALALRVWRVPAGHTEG